MTGVELRQARKQRGWTQVKTSQRLKVTQAYVSMLERERRLVPSRLARRAVKALAAPALALPLEPVNGTQWDAASEDDFAQELGTLGYVGYGYLKGTHPRWNPANLLLAMLTRPQLDARLREALPWLPFRHQEMDWGWVTSQAKLHDVQNRLGFVLTLATALSQKKNPSAVAKLENSLDALWRARLAKEDTLCHESMTQVERRWLRSNRPPAAEQWNLLTDLKVEHLADANY